MSLFENIISFVILTTTSHFFIALVVVLYYFSGRARYYSKLLLIGIWISLGCLLFIPLMLFRPRNALNISLTLKWCKPLSKVLGLDWIVIGQENLAQDNQCSIVLYNHQSFLDLLAFSEIWPYCKKATGLVKKELLYYFPLGPYLWLCGALFIDRRKGKESIDYLNSEMICLQKNETSLIMAPEGTRSKGETIKPFKDGAFRLAVEHGIPIVPVVISPYNLLNHEKHTFNSGKIVISFLPAIQTKNKENNKEAVEEVKLCAWKIMNDEYMQMKRNTEKGFYETH